MLADLGNAKFVQVDVSCPSCKTEFTAREQTGELRGTEIVDSEEVKEGGKEEEEGENHAYYLAQAKGHTHAIQLDANGDGVSSEAAGHSHKVVGEKVQAAEDHVHELEESKPGEAGNMDQLQDNGDDEEGGILDVPQDQIIKFLVENPNPTDAEFHEHSEKMGWNNHEAEAVAYKMATRYAQFRTGGASKGKRPSAVIASEENIGMQVELEHTKNIDDANKIVWDHLVEVKDSKYYTFLIAIEKILKLGPDHELYKKMIKLVDATEDLPRP